MTLDPGPWVAALERDGHAVAEGALDGASASALCAVSPAARTGHRRVLHLEYAASGLPGGLEWADRVAFA